MKRHAVIMAGGAGTRLWPLSRANRPKQLLRLLGGKSLLRQSFERLQPLLEPEDVFIITGARYIPLVAEELPEIPAENLIGEPTGRDTANAIALAAAILHHRDPESVMGVFTADHVIRPQDRFREALDLAYQTATANSTALVSLGIPVRRPETAFGYVKRGREVSPSVHWVEQFTEKPDAETAQRYAADADYFWNSGMFCWRTSAILSELKANLPVSHKGAMDIARAWDGPDRSDRLEAIFPTLQKISIDYAVMERARHVMLVTMDCDWADVGSWAQLESVLDADESGNVHSADRTICHDSHNNTLVSEDKKHLIATVGVNDLVIVHSPDATLVSRKEDGTKLRELVARLREQSGEEYL